MFLSKRCLHGLRAVLYLIIQPADRGWVPVREIADVLNIPFHFLTKIVQDLIHEELLESGRGRSGGIRLAKPAEDLTVLQVIETLEGPSLFRDCVFGFSNCDNDRPCALHEKWAKVRKEITAMFSSESLAELGGRIELENLVHRDPQPAGMNHAPPEIFL